MMVHQILLRTLAYSYPISLCLGLLVSRLVLFSRRKVENPSLIVRKCKGLSSSVTWYLQLCLTALLLASIALALIALSRSFNYEAERGRNQNTYLASHVGVLLYFAAGLLPDPDDSFRPGRSNMHIWIIAVLFELSLLAANHDDETSIVATNLDTVQMALRVSRAAILVMMTAVFIHAQRECSDDTEANCEEQQRLVRDEDRVPQSYGGLQNSQTLAVKEQKKPDAQSFGWLDYFIGFRVLFPYIWPANSRKQQTLAVVCFLLLICQRIVNVLVPYQLGVLVEALGAGKMPVKEIALYVTFSGLQGQQGVLGAIRAMLWISISQSLYQRLTCAAFEHVLSLSLDFHLSKRIGEVMTALSKGSALNTFLDGFAFQLFPMVFDLWVAAIYFFVRFDPFYSLTVLAVMWSYLFVTIYMAKYRGRERRKMAERDREMDAAKTDAIMSYETVHYNCASSAEVIRFQTLVKTFQKAEFSVLFSLNALNITQNLIFTFGILLVVLLSSYQISVGIHKVAMFVSLLAYFAQLQAPLAFFGSFYNQVQNNLVDAERMLDLFNRKPDIVDGPDATPLVNFTGKITFSNVSFAYDVRKPTLDRISFVVEPGTSTAIVGQSGSGKSTCLKLLYRFYDISSGEICIDDKDLRHVKINSIRQLIGVVPQDTILFNASLMYNLLYAKPNATSAEIFEACRAASIHDRILTFPNGYETSVGERGLRLSGGEKQRIAIARAILKEPRVMLLDEATASLDSHTEKQIQNELEAVTRGRTTITVAHRLSTVTRANQILVLHEGRIVERGTHSELLELNGRYREMWEKQTKTEPKEDF